MPSKQAEPWFKGPAAEAGKWRPIIQDIPHYDPIATRGDCIFDPALAAKAIGFIEIYCRHTEGPLAGERLELERWQRAIFANLFGWIHTSGDREGLRRYRRVFVYVPRKNGKTMLAAALVCYVVYCDSEGPGAGRSRLQINGAAGNFDQAALTFTYAAGMIHEEPALHKLARVYDAQTKSIVRYANPEHTGRPLAVYKVLTKGSKGKHGLNTHLAIIDEVHEYEDGGEQVDVIVTSTGARAQPIVAFFTTADFDRPESICNELHDYGERVRAGVLEDQAAREFLPVIYQPEDPEKWESPKQWRIANPNIGVSVSLEYLRSEYEDAKAKPRKINTFKRLHLNIKTSTLTQWIPLEAWDSCQADYGLADLAGLTAWGGLDLASSRDLASFVLVFPKYTRSEVENGGHEQSYRVRAWLWLPEGNIIERERITGAPFTQWLEQGLVTGTPGTRIDYGQIRSDIRRIATEVDIAEIGFDPWQAEQMAGELAEPEDGSRPLTMVRFAQNAPSMNGPIVELEALVAERRIEHDGNPVLRYMVPNVQLRQTNDGLFKPDRKVSKGKIDAVVALLMALGRAGVQQGKPKQSVYKRRGIIRL